MPLRLGSFYGLFFCLDLGNIRRDSPSNGFEDNLCKERESLMEVRAGIFSGRRGSVGCLV